MVSDTDCPSALKATDTYIPGKVIYLGSSSSDTSNIAATDLNSMKFNDDFLLASTYQDSVQADATRADAGSGNYCDYHIWSFTAMTT